MAWMGNESKRVVTLAAADMKWAMWMRVARNYQVRVGLKGDRQRETFDGFTRDVSLQAFAYFAALIIALCRTTIRSQLY